jgi:Ala-tRNA(Pro) deacylase
VSLLALVNDTAHAVEFVIDARLWEAEAVHAHPLRNDATLVIPHAALERFVGATGHAVRVLRIDDNDAGAPASGDAPGRERADGRR